MASGGRPPVDGGHDPLKVSLDKDTLELLNKAKQKGKPMSQVIEKAVKTMAKQFDPGPACPTVQELVKTVEADLDKARAADDFEQVQALAQLRQHLEPYASVCELKPPQSG